MYLSSLIRMSTIETILSKSQSRNGESYRCSTMEEYKSVYSAGLTTILDGNIYNSHSQTHKIKLLLSMPKPKLSTYNNIGDR